jgi:hypothetical protein
MRYINIFNHFNPKRYFDALVETTAAEKNGIMAQMPQDIFRRFLILAG